MVISNDIGLKANKDLSLDGLTFPPSLTFKQPTVIYLTATQYLYSYSNIIIPIS